MQGRIYYFGVRTHYYLKSGELKEKIDKYNYMKKN